MSLWHHRPLVRLLVGAVVGVVSGVLTGLVLGPWAGVLGGWTGASIVMAVWPLLVVWPMDAARTREHAQREDVGRKTGRVIAVVGSLMSLVAVGVVIAQAAPGAGARSYVLAGLAVLSVVASWVLIQVDYMLRYARIYYLEPHGGIDFNEDDDPQYTDFAYFSVGLGLTYQVADTNVRTKELRKVVIAQTLLAYLFGAVILATVINLVTSLA